MSAMQLFDCDRAWAAGLFDGEGSTSCRVGKRTWALQMAIQQVDREVLDRFNAAVDGQGDVYGPYPRRSPNARPYYQLQVGGLVRVQHALAVIWPWLGSIKREQAHAAIATYEARPNPGPLRTGLRLAA